MTRRITPISQPAYSGFPRADEEDGFDLLSLLAVLWSGKWFVLVITVFFTALGVYYAYWAAVPLYRSTAVLILETREEQILNLDSVLSNLSGDSMVVNSEVEVMQSRTVLAAVVSELGLIDDPEFNQSLRAPGLLDSVREQLGVGATATYEERFQTGRTLDALLARLRVRNVPASLVFEVTAETENAEKSARIADAVVAEYIRAQLAAKSGATRQATAWLTERVAVLQTELEQAEARVKAFDARTDLVSPEVLLATERRIKELRDRLAEMQGQALAAEAVVAGLASASGRNEMAAVSGDAQLVNMLNGGDLSDSEAAIFDARIAGVIAEKTRQVARARSQILSLSVSLEDLVQRTERQARDLITLQQLTREAEASLQLYEHFLTRLKETSVQQGMQTADSRILSHAVVPERPSAPRRSLIVALAAVLGAVAGSGYVLLRASRKDTWRTGEELERSAGYTVMGQLPSVPVRTRQKVLGYLLDNPVSAYAEAVRNLRTSVLLSAKSGVARPEMSPEMSSDQSHTPQVVMVTSALAGEGKTTLSLSLATNFAAMGKSVLVIEGDMRRRVLGDILGHRPRVGLMAALSGEVAPEAATTHDDHTGLDFLFGEEGSAGIADVFSTAAFPALLETLRRNYDMIIVDSPPVLLVPDARMMGQYADSILFAIQWDKTTRGNVREGLRMFESIHLRVAGLVLTQINVRRLSKYGYGGRESMTARAAGYYTKS